MMSLCSTSDVITFCHLYSSSVGEKGLSNDTQIRVIGLIEPEIHVCIKMLRNLREKFGAKFLRLLAATGLKMHIWQKAPKGNGLIRMCRLHLFQKFLCKMGVQPIHYITKR